MKTFEEKYAKQIERNRTRRKQGKHARQIKPQKIEEIEDEQWQGWPTRTDYKISDHGRVIGPSGKLLRLTTNNPGAYPGFNVIVDGTSKLIYVHRAVLETFVGPCPPGHECLHKNDNPSDNRLSELRWGTPKENFKSKMENREQRGLPPNPSSHLNEKDVLQIKDRYMDGWSLEDLGEYYFTTSRCIYHIVKGFNWKSIP